MVWYCSKFCQQTHWPFHRKNCKKNLHEKKVNTNDTNDIVDIEDIANPVIRRLLHKKSKQCSCKRCSSLCSGYGNPGIYGPEYFIKQLSEGVDTAILFKNIVADYQFEDKSNKAVFGLRPSKAVVETPGELAPFIPVKGACSMLGPKGCTLLRSNMPLGCVTTMVCETSNAIDKNKIPEVWNSPMGKHVIKLFYQYHLSIHPDALPFETQITKMTSEIENDPLKIIQTSLALYKLQMGV
jgi:hypothetical protein